MERENTTVGATMGMIIALAALYGFLMNRWRGHASRFKKYFPRPLPQIALAVPFAVAAFYFQTILPGGIYAWLWRFGVYSNDCILAVVVLVLTTLAWLTSWGNVYDLNHAPRGDKPAKVEYLILWLHGRIPEYWYDFIGMALRGMLISLPAGIALQNPLLAFSGGLLVLGYALGWAVQDWAVSQGLTERRVDWKGTETYLAIKFMPRHLDGATEIGEAVGGALVLAALAALI